MYDIKTLHRCMTELCDALKQRLEDAPIHNAIFLQYQQERETLDEAGLAHFLTFLELRDALDLEKQIFWLSRGMELGKLALDLQQEPKGD